MKNVYYLVLGILFLISGCAKNEKEAPEPVAKGPVAKVVPKVLEMHGDKRVDNYHWMRLSDEQKNAASPDAQTQDVLEYLGEENEYLQEATKHTTAFQEELYTEMTSRIKKDDQSVPYNENGYSYYTRFREADDYALYCRKALTENAEEEIMLDGPKLAKGHSYFGMGSRSVSSNNKLLAYAVDTVSRRRYDIHFKNLETGLLLPDVLTNTSGGATWANDNKTVFYTVKNPETLREYQVYRHVLGTDQSEDVMVFEETDETFSCGVYKSKSKAFLMIYSYQTLSTEFRYLDANNPEGEWKVVQPRERNLEYQPQHYGDHFYIRTNLDAKNFRLVKTPLEATTKENWADVVPHREQVYLQEFELFKDYLVLEERKGGLTHVKVQPWEGESYYMEFNDPAYLVSLTTNLDFNTQNLRYNYTSLTTPWQTSEMHMGTKEMQLLKQQEVQDVTFSPDNYTSERHMATATDGTKVPISLVYKKGTQKSASTPLMLYSYGSYGSSSEATFSSTRLSLLDRGFIFAIAHIRGGQEMGRDWYEDGKLLKKKNTFTDFIDCGQYLIDNGFTSSDHMYAMGGSAGGLLMGAVLNMRPDMWNGVVAAVPFVDVVTTMADESIPLTTFEFDEWGNPKNKEYYDYIKSYSPYDNVTAQDYPNILITTGYWDSQVQYWEPAKWTAKLRALKTDDNIIVMDCNMENGHSGASGRFERYKRTALYYSFVLDLEGMGASIKD
ncbi:MAG: oligopeptidase B [Bacteroidetes bacterium MedPE-SWsnd-G2]|nr:MAG: oligopeptidase B [Bacteroidetes bacterium MedPE-SWsnd-G2]